MTEPKLEYLGPVPRTLEHTKNEKSWWARLPLPFLLVVVLPVVIATLYFGLIASPRYVSEARFVVKEANQSQPSSLGIALQGVGLSANSSDAFAVHEYMTSRDAFARLDQRFDLERMLAPGNVDPFSRAPRPWEGGTSEARYKAFQRLVTVGYNSTTGISTMRMEAFRPAEAQVLAEALLSGGEDLINRLNQRASTDAVRDAQRSLEDARARLLTSQAALRRFRDAEQIIDPTFATAESSELIGGLLLTLANLKAERTQLAAEAPQSPQLSILDSRIAAYEGQIAQERDRVAGGSQSIAEKIGTFEELDQNRKLAEAAVSDAASSLLRADQEARRQRLYLDRIVNPSRPDKATEPKRLLSILAILLSCLVLYGIGWFIWSGAQEHRQS